jgi:programmed cell death protein 4
MSTELEFKRECEGLVREYFTHGVVTDVEDSLKELLGRPGWTEHGEGLGPDRSDRTPPHRSDGAPPGSSSPAPYAPSPLAPSSLTTPSSLSAASLRAMVVKRAVIAALDRGAREREMAAQLLRALRDKNVISRAHGEAGFDLLLQALESLTIDVPNAPDDMHVFLARAVVDGVVSDEYLEECADAAGLDVEARRVALSARGALRAPGGKERVLDAWGGPEGGTASAAVREMDSLLAEYVESRDAREASRRLVSLHVPFYHHELVKRALVTAVEESYARPQVTRRVTELLGYLGAAGVVSGTQFAKGFARVAVALKELVLDTPDAQEIFERLVADARGRGLLPAGLSAWASFRVGGGGTGAALGRTDGDAMVRDRESASLPRARGGRGGGHLMRLDSAPDLIALAQSLKTVGLEKEKSAPGGERASPLANGAGSRGSPLKGSVNPGPGLVEKEKSRMSPSRLAAQSATAKGAPPKPSSSPEPKPFSTSQQGVLSAVPARVSKSNQVDANWSGLRAPRAGRRDRGASGSAFSGSDSDYVRPKPKRRLPDLRFPNRGDGGGGGAEGASSERPKPVGFGGFAGTRARSPALGRSAWKARFQPAPSRCSGEETRAFKSEASLRRVRALRRVRSAPAGLARARHVGARAVHRHRPPAPPVRVGVRGGRGHRHGRVRGRAQSRAQGHRRDLRREDAARARRRRRRERRRV